MLWPQLTADQKQQVLERSYDINVDHNWWDFTYSDAEDIGIEIWSFDLGRSQQCFIKLHWDAIDIAREILKLHGEQCRTYKVAQDYIAEYMRVKFETDPEDDSDTYDIDEQFEKGLSRAYWLMLYDEYEYLTSEEAIIATIEANEWEFEFDEEGDLI